MDRLSPPRYKLLETLSLADLPRLQEQRKLVAASIDRASTMTEIYRLHNKIAWLDEQIGWLKMQQRTVKP